MWLLVMFDLPVVTKEDRRNYRRFVDKLEDDGYTRVQFSIYVRPCATIENTAVHENRVIDWLPPEGEVRVMKFTDKQWGRMMVFRARTLEDSERPPEQFLFFDEEGLPLVDEEGSEEVVHKALVSRAADPPAETSPTVSVAEQAIAGALIKLTKRASKRRSRSEGKKEETPGFDFFE